MHALKERDIEAYLVKKVTQLGGEVRKVQWIGRRGAPDRLVLLPGRERTTSGGAFTIGARAVWVELKAPGKKPEPHQLREHERLTKFGQQVLVIDSKDLVDYYFDMQEEITYDTD